MDGAQRNKMEPGCVREINELEEADMSGFRKWFFPLLIFALILAGCQPVVSGRLAQSDKPRNSPQPANATDLSALVSGDNAFAFDLFRHISADPGNLVFSPYSISIALAMTYAGAGGDTALQMAQAMHFTLAQDQLHPAFNQLALELDQEGQTQGVPADKAFKLNVVNALWGQDGFPFLSAYLDLLAENYGAGMHLLDFRKDPEGARKVINDWVSQQTAKRINDIIPPGAIDPLTRLVLSNAIYFKADWASEFSKDSTRDAPFTLLDGSQVSVPMMSQHSRFRYSEGDGLQALELPYAGGQLSMILLLPQQGKFNDVQTSLDAEKLDGLVAGLQVQEVNLWLPKFKFEYPLDLKDSLQKMGMIDAFDPNQADLSGMDGSRDLYISAVLHKAFVAVDEAGTEAAAATVVSVEASSMPAGSPVEFKVDRPFFFLIRDNASGAMLFLGRVLNPAP